MILHTKNRPNISNNNHAYFCCLPTPIPGVFYATARRTWKLEDRQLCLATGCIANSLETDNTTSRKSLLPTPLSSYAAPWLCCCSCDSIATRNISLEGIHTGHRAVSEHVQDTEADNANSSASNTTAVVVAAAVIVTRPARNTTAS